MDDGGWSVGDRGTDLIPGRSGDPRAATPKLDGEFSGGNEQRIRARHEVLARVPNTVVNILKVSTGDPDTLREFLRVFRQRRVHLFAGPREDIRETHQGEQLILGVLERRVVFPDDGLQLGREFPVLGQLDADPKVAGLELSSFRLDPLVVMRLAIFVEWYLG